ncbi:MAG: hypothetical protein PHE55_04060 [Methylococcaceae bacterium]|nr:hypothetical protein [Methylococcaceae bacterium]
MDKHDILDRNRVILCHFDSYSTALLFARYGVSVLAPNPLPETASVIPEPSDADERYAPLAALDALTERYGLDKAQLNLVDNFQEWMNSPEGPIRIHLARFTTFEAPHATMEPHGGLFKPISQMRGTPMIELNLLRQAFNLIMT